jgi:integrase
VTNFIFKRDGRYYFRRRVPDHLRRFDTRESVKIALKTGDPAVAARRAIIQNEILEKYWQGLISNKAAHDQAQYRDAVATARSFGFTYKSLAEIASGPVDDIVERLRAVRSTNDRDGNAAALLGAVSQPKLLLSEALDQYFTLTADRLKGKSDLYRRKWENPRKKAVASFIAAVGDKAVADITRRDILDLRKWWVERIAREGLNPLSGNKDLIHLKDILRVMARELEIDEALDVRTLFLDTAFRGVKASRSPFDAAFVQNKILADGALEGLNDEARAIIYLMADTGARVSEITGLLPEDIVLDDEIPHICIRPNKIRTLKTPQSERQIPLVGAALAGARMMPGGFPRYAGRESVSNLINKFFDGKGLRPTAGHTLYSLRHTFKDRLRDVQAPEELINSLMGHATRGPHYGRGHLLKMKKEWLDKIAYKAAQE